jgi:two-component system chemotaxis response regulator CheY
MINTILIVDDSTISRKIVKKCLPKDRQFNLFEAGDGLAGLEKFKEIKPDLVFLDLTMPVMDGVQALKEIIKVDKDAVVVVQTADVQRKTISNVMDAGAFTLLRKPLSPEAVAEVLRLIEGTGHKKG